MRRFPPFAALVAFDALARCGSFTAAAENLGITQSAISHQVKRLEELLGTQLVDRQAGGCVLTAEGMRLSAELAPLLARLASLGERNELRSRRLKVRVGLGQTLSNLWLAARVTAFRADLADIDVEFVETSGDDRTPSEDFDLSIHWVNAARAVNTPTQRVLFREDVFPVCHPRLLAGRPPYGDLDDLVPLGLLHKHAPIAAGAGAEWHWATWYRTFGGHSSVVDALSASPRFNSIGPLIAAAMAGAGVALGRSLLVHDALRSGALVRPLGPAFTMPSSKVHICVWHANRNNRDAVATVAGWIAKASRQTVEGVGASRMPAETAV